MTRLAVAAEVNDLLREAAEWRLVGLLFERPEEGWQERLTGLADEVGDASLREAVELARQEASEELYHTVFGPGGPAPPREVSYRDSVHPGRFLAEIRHAYEAFAYAPRATETPDHVAVEVGFIAYLRLKEAYARARGEAEQAAVCRCASERFIEEHLSIMSQPMADFLEASGIRYLAQAATALLHHAGPPRCAAAGETSALGEREDEWS